MSTLHLRLDAGATLADIMAAHLDLGGSPSLILRSVVALELPVDLRLDAPPRVVPPHHGVLVRASEAAEFFARDGVPPEAALLATDALGRLLVEHAGSPAGVHGRGVLELDIDAAVLAFLLGIATAFESLGIVRVLASGAARASPEARALLETVTGGEETDEPQWVGVVTRGQGARAVASLGRPSTDG